MSDSHNNVLDDRWPQIDLLLDELLDAPADIREKRLSALAVDDAQLSSAVRYALQAADDESFLEEASPPIPADALRNAVRRAKTLSELTHPDTPDNARTIGRYMLDKKLGSGGMSEVWLAHRTDDALEQTVAIKLLHPFLGTEAEQRFNLERSVLATLEHESIARILDAGVATGDPAYLVLEYVDGVNITDYCKDNQLTLHQSLKLFLQICDAVTFAHSRLVVHRDIKPSNVLVTDSGKVKLLDFGIAKLIDKPKQDGLTRTGFFPMTPEYAAPEQIRGRSISTVTDVYSLGTLLYEILTGSRPFNTHGLPPIDIMKLVCDTEPKRPSTHLPTLRGDLDSIVLKALESEPSQRYSSVAELAEDIQRFLRGMPVSARPAAPAYKLGKFIKRNRWSVLLSTIVVSVIAFSVANTVIQKQRQELQLARFNAAGALLFGLFEQIDPEIYPGQKLSPKSLLDYADAQLSQLEAGPQVKVDMLRVLGVLYARLGEWQRSESLLRRSVAVAQSDLRPSNSTIGQTINSLGFYLAQQGKLAQGEEQLRAALVALTDAGDTGHWTLNAQSDLAYTLSQQGNEQEALRLFERSVSGYRQLLSTDPRSYTQLEFAKAQNRLAKLYISTGQLDLATRVLIAAQENASHTPKPNHPELARAVQASGTVLLRQNQLDAARDRYNRALQMFRDAYPNGHQSIGRVLMDLADLEERAGNESAALDQLTKALAVWPVLPIGTPSQMADRYQARARYAFSRGQFEQAIRLQEQAVAQRARAHENNTHRLLYLERQRLEEFKTAMPN